MVLPSFADAGEIDWDQTQLGLDAASQTIRDYCQWHIWPEVTETLILNGTGTSLLRVPTMKLTTVTAVTETYRGSGQVPSVVSIADLEWEESGLIRHPRCWTPRARGVSVTVTHGYVVPPANIVQLVFALVKRAKSNPGGLKRIQVGQRAEDYNAAQLLLEEKSILEPYRRLV